MGDQLIGAIILAGGRGSRMRPLTDRVPKPLLPVAGEPLVRHQIRRLAQGGVSRVVLSTGYLAEAFERALGAGEDLGVHLAYALEKTPLGTGGGLMTAWQYVRHTDAWASVSHVIVFNGDLLGSHSLAAHMACHTKTQADVTIHARTVPDVSDYGVLVTCDGSPGWRTDATTRRIATFEEKPPRHEPGLVNAGTYVVTASCLDALANSYLPTSETVSLERDVFPALISHGARLVAYRDETPFLDVGNPMALLEANLRMGAHATDLVHGATIDPSADVRHSLVLPGARVGAHAYLRHCVVNYGADVPPAARYENAVLA